MRDRANVATPYGPIDIDIFRCDGPSCEITSQEAYMVGWYRIEPMGVSVATFGTPPIVNGESHYHSSECFLKALKETRP